MVGMLVAAEHPEADVFPGRALQLPRAADADGVAIEQQADHQPRVIRLGAAGVLGLVDGLDRAEVELGEDVEEEEE